MKQLCFGQKPFAFVYITWYAKPAGNTICAQAVWLTAYLQQRLPVWHWLVQNLHVLFVAPCRALLDSMSKRNWWTGAPIIRSSSSPTRYRPVWTAKYAPLGLSKFEGELAQTFGQIKCIQMQVPNAGICLKMLLVNKQQHVNARSNLFH